MARDVKGASLNAPRLAEAIKMVRQQTDRGTININTNAGFSSGLSQLYDAGLDSMRVTIFHLMKTTMSSIIDLVTTSLLR